MAAQTGSEFKVVRAEKNWPAANSPDADAVICPSAMLGTLAAGGLISPLPEKLLHGAAGQWEDIFELLRLREAAWGGEVFAVPLGSPTFVCYYRADLLEKLARKPPQTWDEYAELAQLLAAQKLAGNDGPWCGAIEPLAADWAGLTLLARAAPYAKHRDNYSALFDIGTMDPLVGGPPFVRALEELVATAKLGPPRQLQLDPAGVRAAFWAGQCGMALTWPTAAGKSPSAAKDIRVGFAELPGSPQAYNIQGKTWEPLGEGADPHVPLLGVAGRVGAISAHAAPGGGGRASPLAFRRSVGAAGLSGQPGDDPVPPFAVEIAPPMDGAAGVARRSRPVCRPDREDPAAERVSVGYPVAGPGGVLGGLGRGGSLRRDRQVPPGRRLADGGRPLAGTITARLGAERQRTAYRQSLGVD